MATTDLLYNELINQIIGCAIRVHTTLGPGLFEQTYEECLAYELDKAGLWVERQKPIKLKYEALEIDAAYRLDLLVEDKIILELKAVAELVEIHSAQILTYLKLTQYPVGLLMNFNVPRLKDGIKRYVL
jgi:GxxExxY protein